MLLYNHTSMCKMYLLVGSDFQVSVVAHGPLVCLVVHYYLWIKYIFFVLVIDFVMIFFQFLELVTLKDCCQSNGERDIMLNKFGVMNMYFV